MKSAEISTTISQQIGNQALTMLGAHTLINHGDGLSFKIRGSRRVNYIKVTLDASDTYTVEFKKLGRAPMFEVKDIDTFYFVHVGSLHGLIESETGLYTKL